MSIYATLWNIKVHVLLPDKPCPRTQLFGHAVSGIYECWFEVWAQAVPGHIKYDVPWLLPPVKDDDALRCVLFIEGYVEKGGPGYDGQQYHEVLAQISGEQYRKMSIADVLDLLEEALEKRHWPRKQKKAL